MDERTSCCDGFVVAMIIIITTVTILGCKAEYAGQWVWYKCFGYVPIPRAWDLACLRSSAFMCLDASVRMCY